MSGQSQHAGASVLNVLLREAALKELTQDQVEKFDRYLELILRWNARMNLTAVRNAEEIIRRHFFECIACAQLLPIDIETMLDLGSGAGFPGVPIAIYRSELKVTLAESQNKKAAFLREVGRSLDLDVNVFAGRAEALELRFDCVTLRAVDGMASALRRAIALLKTGGWLMVMTSTHQEEAVRSAANEIVWQDPVLLYGSEQRIAMLGISSVPRGTSLH